MNIWTVCVRTHNNTTEQDRKLQILEQRIWSLNQEAGFRFGLRYFQIQKSGFRSRKSDSEIWIQNQKSDPEIQIRIQILAAASRNCRVVPQNR